MNWQLLLSRRLPQILAVVVLIELTLPLWAAPALKITHDGYLSAVPLAVPAQFVVVAILLYTVSSAFHEFERQAARSMRLEQAVLWLITALLVVASTMLASVLIGDTGTLGALAPVKATLGMWGIGLIASAFFDRRLAGIVPAAALLLPAIVSPGLIPGAEIWGFALAPDDSLAAWVTAGGFLAIGATAHILMSSARRR
ncbi:MAG: hypothetical protein EAS51_12465 [Microbacteriaceae bacterium]|nr:MAG: hypothetical protein EAS51_12465 [Microbacteriaceae bacterium]